MDGNVILATDVISSFMDYDGDNNVQRFNHSEDQSHKFSKKMYILVLKPEYSSCFP